jgi:hypothetical protein
LAVADNCNVSGLVGAASAARPGSSRGMRATGRS